ncbi:Taurine catabolism dioxygenase [Mycena venus]|uniref:Taurine catabolism dioxygenase n=1 Tax=Mycena venus TaxID=2733690 RepID=A0A8H7CG28_9AGAR|nr:Taurine catabolism dioxygenase [Mycena venus]
MRATTLMRPTRHFASMSSVELLTISSIAQRDETPTIGTRFMDPHTSQLSRWLADPNSDNIIRELAILVARRGVVFFPEQDITIEQQKHLARRMGELTGRPTSSGLHKHPISPETPELGKDVSVISSMGGISRAGIVDDTRASNGWHTDIPFEPVPADYSILKMRTIPEVGGDTLWASGYEAYDKLSPAFAKFLEGLTAIHSADFFLPIAAQMGLTIQDNRGHPENSGTHLTAIQHPSHKVKINPIFICATLKMTVHRTHPVTGFKSLYVDKSFTTRIVELSTEESSDVLAYLTRHISENHDLQVRYRWGVNDVAIWDNRCALHTATNDYGSKAREGNRVVGIGEKPFFDPASVSRRASSSLVL